MNQEAVRIGVVGPQQVGKTTLINAMFGGYHHTVQQDGVSWTTISPGIWICEEAGIQRDSDKDSLVITDNARGLDIIIFVFDSSSTYSICERYKALCKERRGCIIPVLSKCEHIDNQGDGVLLDVLEQISEDLQQCCSYPCMRVHPTSIQYDREAGRWLTQGVFGPFSVLSTIYGLVADTQMLCELLRGRCVHSTKFCFIRSPLRRNRTNYDLREEYSQQFRSRYKRLCAKDTLPLKQAYFEVSGDMRGEITRTYCTSCFTSFNVEQTFICRKCRTLAILCDSCQCKCCYYCDSSETWELVQLPERKSCLPSIILLPCGDTLDSSVIPSETCPTCDCEVDECLSPEFRIRCVCKSYI